MKLSHLRTTDGLFRLMRRHPYLLTVMICCFLLPFGMADRAKITGRSCLYLGILGGVVAVGTIFFFRLGRSLQERLVLSTVSAAGIAAAMLIIHYISNKTIAIPLIALAAAVVAVVVLRATRRLGDTAVIAVLMLLGVAIRFTYVLYTGSGDRQHDVGFFNWTWGHANYIEYWYNNGLKLPDFDVRNIWQYYHPPFHHWLMALLLRLLTWLKVEYLTACEAMQILPMLYSSLTMIVCYRVFRMVKLSGKPLTAAIALICFHPTFILFAASFNNDMLLMLMVMSAVMWGLRWYRAPKLRNIIPLALCIGLGMMTKLSGWMVAPAVAFLFLIRLIRNIKKPLKYIGQYALFGVICAPLGLWWQVRNLIAFGVPLTYVPVLNTADPIYSGNLSLSERLFNFGGQQLTYVYDAYTAYGSPYNEFNPTLGLFKTAMFDEGTNNITAEHFPQITVTAPILYWISVVLFLCCFICFIVMMVRKGALSGVERAYFALLMGVHLISYYGFCFAYPFTCTLNIRYCMPVIPLCAMGLGLALQHSGNSKRAVWTRRCAYALCAAFCAMSYLVYTQIGATVL